LLKHKVSENPPFLTFQPALTAEDLSIGYNVTDKKEEKEDRSLSDMPIEEWLKEFEPPRIDDKNSGGKKGFKLSRIPIFEEGVFDFLEEEQETKPKKQKKNILKKSEKEILEKVPPKIETNIEEQELKPLEEIHEKKEDSVDRFDLFLSQTDVFLKSLGDKKERNPEESTTSWKDDSIVENEEVASETLADLLALQGQKLKAIKMYKTLSLKFPKKSRLFADKIAELT